MRRIASITLIFGLFACDKEPTRLEQMAASATASTAPSAPLPPPPAPTKPQLAVDDSAAFVAGERFDLTQPDPKGRLVAALSTRPVSGEVITLEAAREAKTPRVATVFAALAASKAKGVLVHTRRRDGSTAEIPFTLAPKTEACTAVGYIAKDSAINAWKAGGGMQALRFTRGMAGPDLTRGSEGVRKLIAACDAPAWLVASDDAVTWGLVVDLVLAVAGMDDGGTPPRAREIALAAKATPGQKVDE